MKCRFLGLLQSKELESDASSSTLRFWLVESGGPYDYYHVPQRIYDELLRARSAGGYYNDHIRDRYSSNR
ncbi:KTSC domain-containing protein [Ensifer sp. NBAIM29]|nr:KTSC domain-containing protein [Ensifer sp. NBAIM29]